MAGTRKESCTIPGNANNVNRNMIITIARHAETPENEKRILVGHSQVGLSAVGITQAKSLARWAKTNDISEIISSNQTRAIETAEIVRQELGQSYLSIDSNLRERDYGSFDGLTRQALVERRTLLGLKNLSPTQDWNNVTDVEADSSIWKRTRPILDMLRDTRSNTNHVMLITHAGVMKAALYSILQIPSSQFCYFKFPNCCHVSIQPVGNYWQLIEFGRI